MPAVSTTVSKLVLMFKSGDGKDMNLSYNYADPEVATSKVSALMNGIIANSEIFDPKPASAVGAKIITTTTTELDLY